jgi:hypothetical protein
MPLGQQAFKSGIPTGIRTPVASVKGTRNRLRLYFGILGIPIFIGFVSTLVQSRMP